MKEKIGVGITTYNSESYFETLYNSLPRDLIDELVVVNGGEKYTKTYPSKWIQHTTNKFPSVCRNECIKYLLEKNCDHIFIIEDDMIITNKNIFNEYIKASKATGLKYLCYVSTSPGAGAPFKRTPKTIIEYPNNIKILFYHNMCNEFTYHHKSVFESVGFYDENMRDAFDVDLAYRESQTGGSSLFWWFADINDSDNFIKNNPVAISRLQSPRPDGSRNEIINNIWKYFHSKHGLFVNEIPLPTLTDLKSKLKQIYKNS